MEKVWTALEVGKNLAEFFCSTPKWSNMELERLREVKSLSWQLRLAKASLFYACAFESSKIIEKQYDVSILEKRRKEFEELMISRCYTMSLPAIIREIVADEILLDLMDDFRVQHPEISRLSPLFTTLDSESSRVVRKILVDSFIENETKKIVKIPSSRNFLERC